MQGIFLLSWSIHILIVIATALVVVVIDNGVCRAGNDRECGEFRQATTVVVTVLGILVDHNHLLFVPFLRLHHHNMVFVLMLMLVFVLVMMVMLVAFSLCDTRYCQAN